jgi:hypothetical protein
LDKQKRTFLIYLSDCLPWAKMVLLISENVAKICALEADMKNVADAGRES